MKRMIWSLVAAALASCSSAGLKNYRLESGAAWLEHDEPLGTLPTVGVGLTFQDDLPPAATPVTGWVGDVALRVATVDEDLGGATLTGDREELDLGTRFYPYSGSDFYQPFVGFGGVLSRLHLEDGDVGHSTTMTPGIYGVVGVEFALGRRLRLGIAYRHTAGVDAELAGDDEESNLDGGAVLVSLGLGL